MLVTFPGFAQNANGAIHPRGAHNQMTFVVDGLPISDQLTGAFANALDCRRSCRAWISSPATCRRSSAPRSRPWPSSPAAAASALNRRAHRRGAGGRRRRFNTWHTASATAAAADRAPATSARARRCAPIASSTRCRATTSTTTAASAAASPASTWRPPIATSSGAGHGRAFALRTGQPPLAGTGRTGSAPDAGRRRGVGFVPAGHRRRLHASNRRSATGPPPRGSIRAPATRRSRPRRTAACACSTPACAIRAPGGAQLLRAGADTQRFTRCARISPWPSPHPISTRRRAPRSIRRCCPTTCRAAARRLSSPRRASARPTASSCRPPCTGARPPSPPACATTFIASS